MKPTLILATLISLATLTSCYTSALDEPTVIEEPQTTLTRLDVAFTTTEAEWNAQTRALSAENAEVSRISLNIFDGADKSVLTMSQIKGDTDFGSFADLHLQPGTYTFAIVAHKATSASDPVATISSPTSATLPGDYLLDTYATTKQVTIATGQTQSITIDVPLCVSKLVLTTLDDVPAGVSSIRLTTNTSAPALTSFTFNPTTGLLPQAASISRTWDISSYADQPIKLNYFLLASQFPLTTDIKVDLLGPDGNVTYTRTYSNITFNRAKVRTIQTYLFSGTSSNTLTFEEWTTEEVMVID